ncbi:MAG: RDD family protein [Bacteroidota bacterium]
MVYIERVLDSEWSTQAKPFIAAPHLKRLCNFLIDFFIGGTITALILGTLSGLLMTLTDTNSLLDYYQQSLICRWAMTAVVLISYYTCCEFIFQGKTLGKFITKTRVVSLDERPLSLSRIFVRSLARCIPFETISFLLRRGPQKPGGWHDQLTNTLVVEDRWYPGL